MATSAVWTHIVLTLHIVTWPNIHSDLAQTNNKTKQISDLFGFKSFVKLKCPACKCNTRMSIERSVRKSSSTSSIISIDLGECSCFLPMTAIVIFIKHYHIKIVIFIVPCSHVFSVLAYLLCWTNKSSTNNNFCICRLYFSSTLPSHYKGEIN